MNPKLWVIPALLGALILPSGVAQERLTIHPPRFELDDGRDQPRFVVLHHQANGIMEDVTGTATVRFDGGVAESAGGHLAPITPGSGRLVAEWGGLLAEAPVRVLSTETPGVSFRHDVIPILTHRGCNAGGCHGAASGKGGFQLSLFGFDPAADHRRITREARARRLDRIHPMQSLLLAKPTGGMAHGGSLRIRPEEPEAAALARWVAEGSQDDPGASPVESLRIHPETLVSAPDAPPLRFSVVATYGDGRDRDVTDQAILSSTDDRVATVDGLGSVRPREPGETTIMARFGTRATVCTVEVLASSPPPPWPADRTPRNTLDEILFEKIRRKGLLPAPLCDDSTFVRRVHLDLANRLPTVEEVRTFFADNATDKRARLVDALLSEETFADTTALEWAEALRVERQRLEPKGVRKTVEMLRAAFHEDRPVDQLAKSLLTARGPSFSNPAANFYLTETDPKAIAENVAQVFLGIRIQCAQCHNHPFERWTLDDYYGFTAFFARVARKRTDDPREQLVFERGSGEVTHPVSGQSVPPQFLGGAVPKIDNPVARRDALAEWMTKRENPWFGTNIANRVFARLMGRGIIDPTDDVRVSNPPSHPALLEHITEVLLKGDFRIKPLVRYICASYTYQMAPRTDGAPANLFSGASVRRLSAEQLLSAISSVTEVPETVSGYPTGTPITQVADAIVPGLRFLELFGRSDRSTACTCQRTQDPTLGQALHLINGLTVESRLLHPAGRLRRLLASASDDAILDEIWLAAYSRPCTDEERARFRADLAASEDREQFYADFLWAVLNSKEFLFQH